MNQLRIRPRRSLVAMATAIRDGVARANVESSDHLRLSAADLGRVLEFTRRIETATRRGWTQAAARLARKLPSLARIAERQLNDWLQRRVTPGPALEMPAGTDLVRDLAALEAEFGAVSCDFEASELFVTTEPIALEGIELGRFEIRLNWTKVPDGDSAFRVVALEPNSAADSDLVTHPHVRDERICLGDGRRAVNRSLARWHLFDFFIVVNQILSTYSAERAFVRLADWLDRRACGDCGSSLDEDSAYYCQGCSTALCEDCLTYCGGCSHEFCSRCSPTCDHCDGFRCAACLSTCAQCKAAVCSDCREHDSLCTKCHEQHQSDDSTVEPVARDARHEQSPHPARAAV
jgi:hypothetical protein